MNNMERYIMVTFPDVQRFMEHPRWNECLLCMDVNGDSCINDTYMVPEDLYRMVTNI